MKHFGIVLISLLIPLNLMAKPQPVPTDLKKEIRAKVERSGQDLLAVEDCPFLLQIFDPKDPHVTPLGLCFYTHVQWQGIYKHVACVGALVEPVSGAKNAFYGKNGHWGVEKACETPRLIAKIKEEKTETTLNPITDLRMKMKEGRRIRLLRDDLGIWPTVEAKLSKK